MMSSSTPARVRFAPSPTGRFHIGSARTALYDYLVAQQTGGQFILRIEDTDAKRYVSGSEDEIVDGMRWLGLDWDEGPHIGGPHAPYHQSERLEIYQEHAQRLVHTDKAYYCFCSPERLARVRQTLQKQKKPPRYDGLCRRLSSAEAIERADSGESYTIRFKTVREGTTTATDLLRGPITVDNATLDDYILLKSNGRPVYHLAAMVDDHLMEISHVLRGSEWLPTFPLHVQIFEAFGWEQPTWVHLSVFLNPSGKGKLSKRHAVDPKSGIKAIFTLDLMELGYLPEAVNNWIALMGWSYDDRREDFTLQELIESFSLEKLTPSPAAVNFSKLDHFNGIYIRNLKVEQLSESIKPFYERAGLSVDDELLKKVVPLIQERMRTLEEGVSISGFFFQEKVDPQPDQLIGKNLSVSESIDAAQKAFSLIQSLSTFEAESLEAELRDLAQELSIKAGQLFGILRVAVTGQKVSPPLIESMVLIGKDEVLSRIEEAINLLKTVNS